MHIFTALLFTNDDSTAISTKKTQTILQKTGKPKEKFELQVFLKEKLLEPSVKKIYGEYVSPLIESPVIHVDVFNRRVSTKKRR